MILIDNSQIVLSHLFQIMKHRGQIEGNEDFLRSVILSSYKMYRNKFHKDYGELVICHDSGDVWRRDYFPNYKMNRRNKRDTDGIDWDTAYRVLSDIRDEFIHHLPYKDVRVERTEADDIIAVLAREYAKTEKVMIVSSDKDFQQLHDHPNIHQFSPLKKTLVKCKDPKYYLLEHIIRGDSSDGVPNVFSDDDSCINPDKRQKPCLMSKFVDVHTEYKDTSTFQDENLLRNWKRNERIIDLSQIPANIQQSILDAYRDAKVPDRSGLFDYFLSKGLVDLMESIQEF